MSLNYELGGVANWQDWVHNAMGTVDCVCFLTMFVGMGQITEDNWFKFATRTRMWERAVGPIRADGEFMDPGVIKDFIGLRTNASSLTDAQFRKAIWSKLEERSAKEVGRATSGGRA